MIGCIFAENGPLEGGIESSFWGTGWGAKGDFRRIFGPDPFIFEGGPPTIFRKHMPSGMGTESLGVIGCIFAENGPLEGGIESSFWGTGWGAKGDFMRYSYLYPYIFESRTHTFFESTCPGWGAKGDFRRIIPNFAVRIAQGMCFRKRYGFSIRKCTGIGKNNAWNHP